MNLQAAHVNVKGSVVRKEDTTEEDPLLDTIQNTTSTTELMDQDPLEDTGNIVKKEKIEEDEQITVKEDLEDEDCDLESKIEVVDDMLAVYKTKSADLAEFLEDTNEDPASEDQKSVEVIIKKEKREEDEQITVKEELEDEDCDLEFKIEVVDDMLAVYKTESADLTEFLEDNNEDPATEDQKSLEVIVKKEKKEEANKIAIADDNLL